MWFKSVLTFITDPAQAETAISAAARVALANDGHLDVLAIGIDETQMGYASIGGGAMLTEFSVEGAEDDARLAEAAARSELAQQDPALRWSLETSLAQVGSLTGLVSDAALFADLVVQTLPFGTNQSPNASAVVEAALFGGHALVLIVPDNADMAHLAAPRRVILAWNQSDEALTAAKRALPLLQAAGHVDITVVDPPPHGPERSDPGGRLCQFLIRHGVQAGVTVLARSMPKASDVLARHALDTNADLLVMGAYGHSRLREAVLGGATRAILQHAAIPVLMAH